METTIEVRGYITKDFVEKEDEKQLILIQQPMSSLPQTNEIQASWLQTFGGLLLITVIVAVFLFHKRKKENEEA